MRSKPNGEGLCVVMLGHKRVPGREGGVESVVEELAVRMAEQGVDVTLINRYRPGDERMARYKGVRIRRAFTLESRSLNAVIYAFFAMLMAACGRYDVIHVHAEGSCAMLPIAKLAQKRTVATIHGLDWQRAKWGGFATRFLLFGERCAAKYADEVIVLSRGVQEYFRARYGRETRLIGNGVDCAVNRPARRITEKWGLQAGGYILFLARIVPEKGLHDLLDAFAALDTDMKLVVAGDNSHADDYFRSIREKAAKDTRVIMTGFASGEILDELYTNCFLYVLPSSIEGMPMTLLEAMSHGCLCLVSDIPENTDVLDGAGLTFELGKIDSLRGALRDALASESSETLKTAARVRSEAFSWGAVVDQTVECYRPEATHRKRQMEG